MGVTRNSAHRTHVLKRASSWEALTTLAPYELVKGATAGAWNCLCRELDGHRKRASERRSAAAASSSDEGLAELRPGKLARGSLIFMSIVFLAAAYPFILPQLFLGFAAVALPLRIYDFLIVNHKNAFFLLDFCYFVNFAVAWFLLSPIESRDPRVEAALYALADGPVAVAIAAWQTAWVFSSTEHTISVLVHLMPGLAMYAHRHLPRLHSLTQLIGCADKLRSAATALGFSSCVSDGGRLSPGLPPGVLSGLTWTFAVPMLFYAAWQLVYFIVVQVLSETVIRGGNFDTSYKCLARRAVRANNGLSRLVLNGPTARRLVVYGALQAAYTAAALLFVAVPCYYSWHLAFIWQVAKFVLPVNYGARHLCSRLIKAAISDAVRRRAEGNLKENESDEVVSAQAAGRRRQSATGNRRGQGVRRTAQPE